MKESEYYKTRLEHTSQDTRGYTRLIYMINGAVLALLYLAIEHGEKLTNAVGVARVGLAVLALINVCHVFFMFRQREWYRRIDGLYATAVDVEPVKLSGFWAKWYFGSHALYAYIHIGLAAVLVWAAIFAKSFILP